MPRHFVIAVLGTVMISHPMQALAAESTAFKVGFLAGGGQGGSRLQPASNYQYFYLGSYCDTPKLIGPFSWRLVVLFLDVAGTWYRTTTPDQINTQTWRMMTGPSLQLSFSNGWWLWDSLQAGVDWDREAGFFPQLVVQNNLMFGLGFFSSHWSANVRLPKDGGYQLMYATGQVFFSLAPWFAVGPEVKYQEYEPSWGGGIRIGENQPEQHWNVTGGYTYDGLVGSQWHADLWFGF
jgi:hypothetical protein